MASRYTPIWRYFVSCMRASLPGSSFGSLRTISHGISPRYRLEEKLQQLVQTNDRINHPHSTFLNETDFLPTSVRMTSGMKRVDDPREFSCLQHVKFHTGTNEIAVIYKSVRKLRQGLRQL